MTIQTSIDSIYDGVKKSVVKKSFDAADAMNILVSTMQAAEKYKDDKESLSGRNKKIIVMAVVSRIISDLPIDDGIKANLKFFTDAIMPAAIDMIVAASKSQLAINAKKKFSACCFKS